MITITGMGMGIVMECWDIRIRMERKMDMGWSSLRRWKPEVRSIESTLSN